MVLIYVVASAGQVLLIAALAVLKAEHHNPRANIKTFGDALRWAAATMSTRPHSPSVDQEPAPVGAVTVHPRCAVARAPADRGAVREQRVTGRAALGRDLDHAAIW
jgi:hypothetical protein